MANSNNIKNSINFYTKPTLMLKKSTSNLWLISVLVIGKVEQLPTWKIKNQSQNIKYKNWNLLHSDKLAKNIYFYQADIECTLFDVKSVVDFSIAYNNEEYTSSINLPAIGQMPNTTYSSCHGFSSASIANKFKDKKNTMLDRLLEVATKNAKFELCLMGGDQIYSDEIFSVSNEFKEWSEKSSDEQVGAKFTKTMHKNAKECYLNCYMRNWCNPSFNQIISTMPAIMMWDDHDIIDGWGSYDEGLQNSAMHQNLYQIAELYFCIFQQHRLPQTKLESGICKLNNKNKTNFYVLGNVILLNLDLRSERNYNNIISDNSWIEIFNYVSDFFEEIKINKDIPENYYKHMFVMSSIPIAHPDFGLLEKILGIMPFRQELEDDLHDHWSTRQHRDERKRLVIKMIEWAINYNCRVSILSGDVHIAANGLIQSHRTNHCKNARSINQITSSGVMHPPPPAMVVFAIDTLMKNKWDIDRDIVVEMLEMPNLQKNFVATRNFVSLCDEEGLGIKVSWYIENEEYPLIKWIRRVNICNPV